MIMALTALKVEINMTKAYIVTPLRSAVGKAFRGGLRTKRPDDLQTDLIRAVLAKTPALILMK